MAIKEMLKEELDNSIRMERDYLEAIAKLPKGSIIKKNIRGNIYYYLVMRDNGKVKFIYKGKMEKADIDKYHQATAYRAKYRRLLSKVRSQIRFLRKMIHAKSTI